MADAVAAAVDCFNTDSQPRGAQAEATPLTQGHVDATPLTMEEWNRTANENERNIVNKLMSTISDIREKPSGSFVSHMYDTVYDTAISLDSSTRDRDI